MDHFMDDIVKHTSLVEKGRNLILRVSWRRTERSQAGCSRVVSLITVKAPVSSGRRTGVLSLLKSHLNIRFLLSMADASRSVAIPAVIPPNTVVAALLLGC